MEELLNEKPGTSKTYMVAAAVYSAAGDSSKAEGMLREAIASDPKDFAPRAAMTTFYYRHKRLTDAENELKKAASELPDKLKPLSALANFYISIENLDNAEKTALDGSPDRAEAHMMLAGFYLASGRPVDAEGVYRAGVGKFPGVVALRKKYAELLLDMGKQGEAEKHIKEVSNRDPSGYYSLYLNGRLKAVRGQFPEAQSDLQ